MIVPYHNRPYKKKTRKTKKRYVVRPLHDPHLHTMLACCGYVFHPLNRFISMYLPNQLSWFHELERVFFLTFFSECACWLFGDLAHVITVPILAWISGLVHFHITKHLGVDAFLSMVVVFLLSGQFCSSVHLYPAMMFVSIMQRIFVLPSMYQIDQNSIYSAVRVVTLIISNIKEFMGNFECTTSFGLVVAVLIMTKWLPFNHPNQPKDNVVLFILRTYGKFAAGVAVWYSLNMFSLFHVTPYVEAFMSLFSQI
jgi:hypothetical protein